MEQLQAEDFAVREACAALDVSASGFYAHRHKDERPRHREDQVLARELKSAFDDSRGTYGSPRLVRALRGRGLHTSSRPAHLQKPGAPPDAKTWPLSVPKAAGADHNHPEQSIFAKRTAPVA